MRLVKDIPLCSRRGVHCGGQIRFEVALHFSSICSWYIWFLPKLARSAIVITRSKIMQLLIALSLPTDICLLLLFFYVCALFHDWSVAFLLRVWYIQIPSICKLSPRLLMVALRCDITPSSRYGIWRVTSSRIGVVSPKNSCAAERVMRKSLFISSPHRRWHIQCVMPLWACIDSMVGNSIPPSSYGPYTTVFGVFQLMPIFGSITIWLLLQAFSINF